MVYINKPETLEQLNENINREIRGVGSETLEGVIVQVLERAWTCEAKNGHHLNAVIFHNGVEVLQNLTSEYIIKN